MVECTQSFVPLCTQSVVGGRVLSVACSIRVVFGFLGTTFSDHVFLQLIGVFTVIWLGWQVLYIVYIRKE